MQYAKTIAGTITYFNGHTLDTGSGVISNPSHQEMRDAGWKPMIASKAPSNVPEGKVWVQDGWIEATGMFLPKWKLADIPTPPPPPPKKYDKYEIADSLMELSLWDSVKEWLMTIPNAYDRIMLTPYISEDEPLLASGIEIAKTQFGLTDEQIASILAKAEME